MLYRSILSTLLILNASIFSVNAEILSPSLISQNQAQNQAQSQDPKPELSNLDRGFQLVIDGREQFKRGKVQEGLQLLQKAIAIFQKEGDHFSEARTHNFIGNAYLKNVIIK